MLGLSLLAGGAGAQGFAFPVATQPHTIEAMQAAVDCRFEDALRLASAPGASPPGVLLFSRLVLAAVHTELGQTGQAARVIEQTTNDPALNPSGAASHAEVAEGAEEVLAAIRRRRSERTGSGLCPF